jgi:Transglutaminase-like superfamily
MWKAFERFRALDPEARRLFARAVILLAQVTLSLHVRGFKRTKEALHHRLQSVSRPAPESGIIAANVQMTCRMVKAAAHYGLVRPTCLVQSLSLWYLLQKQSIPAVLRIGVRKLSDKFEAHAWVEYVGLALDQPEEHHQHYAVFESGFSDFPGENS